MGVGAAVVRADWIALDSMWMASTPVPIIRLGTYIKPPDAISTAYFINHSQQ
jgi:hypothetical protein